MVNEFKAVSQLTSSYKWEILGDDVVALDSDEGRVFRLTGPSAKVVKHILNGNDHGLTRETYDETVAILASEGLVTVSESEFTRRRMIGVGAAAVVGISVMILPAAPAAASGVSGSGGGGGGVSSFNAPLIQSTGPTVTWV